MTGDLTILVPVLDRPHRVKPLLDSIEETTPGVRVMFLANRDDTRELDAIAVESSGRDLELGSMEVFDGAPSYAEKINQGIRVCVARSYFLGADDLNFKPGWLEAASRALRGGAEVVGVNDLLRRRPRRRGHATHFLITRRYAEQPCLDGSRGPCSEAYNHNFVDDELIATARAREVYAYAPRSEVEHLHWMNRRAEVDATYEKGRGTFEIDRRTFESRRHLWA